jgi:hypothetical protein
MSQGWTGSTFKREAPTPSQKPLKGAEGNPSIMVRGTLYVRSLKPVKRHHAVARAQWLVWRSIREWSSGK